MKLLAIETSGEACSASLLMSSLNEQGEPVYQLFDRYNVAPRQHAQLILTMIESVLEESGSQCKDIDAIALSHGPGSFTGLRIATGVAQGLALALNCPIIPVITLQAIALQAFVESKGRYRNILVANDARMNELYVAYYQLSDLPYNAHLNQFSYVNESDIQLTQPDNLPTLPSGDWLGVGTGWAEYSEQMATNDHLSLIAIQELLPSSHYIVRLAAKSYLNGEVINVEDLEPLYLRNKVAHTIVERMKLKN